MLKIDWQKLRKLQNQLYSRGHKPDSILKIVAVFKNAQERSVKIKVKNFLKYIWELDSQHSNIKYVTITDAAGRFTVVLESMQYHPENIPDRGHRHIVKNFRHMGAAEREPWLKMTMTSIAEFMERDSA